MRVQKREPELYCSWNPVFSKQPFQRFLVKGIQKLGDYFDAKTRLIGLKCEFLCAEARLLIEKRKRNNQHLSLTTRLRENQTNEAEQSSENSYYLRMNSNHT